MFSSVSSQPAARSMALRYSSITSGCSLAGRSAVHAVHTMTRLAHRPRRMARPPHSGQRGKTSEGSTLRVYPLSGATASRCLSWVPWTELSGSEGRSRARECFCRAWKGSRARIPPLLQRSPPDQLHSAVRGTHLAPLRHETSENMQTGTRPRARHVFLFLFLCNGIHRDPATRELTATSPPRSHGQAAAY